MTKIFGAQIATLALLITTMISNSTCAYLVHQEPLPDTAKKLRKF